MQVDSFNLEIYSSNEQITVRMSQEMTMKDKEKEDIKDGRRMKINNKI